MAQSNFYDASARVPLQMAWPEMRVREAVSLVDMVASFLEARPGLSGEAAVSFRNEAFSEYLAHGVQGPMAMLRRGAYKFNYRGDRPELYDMESDPGDRSGRRPVLCAYCR